MFRGHEALYAGFEQNKCQNLGLNFAFSFQTFNFFVSDEANKGNQISRNFLQAQSSFLFAQKSC